MAVFADKNFCIIEDSITILQNYNAKEKQA
jgi:hypothetical protein